MISWLMEHWHIMIGISGVGGILAALGKVVPGLWGLLVNAGSAPYYKGTTEVAERLLDIKTKGEARAIAEAEQLAKDLAKSWDVIEAQKRSIAELRALLASSPASSPSTSPPSKTDPPSARPSKRRDPASS